MPMLGPAAAASRGANRPHAETTTTASAIADLDPQFTSRPHRARKVPPCGLSPDPWTLAIQPRASKQRRCLYSSPLGTELFFKGKRGGVVTLLVRDPLNRSSKDERGAKLSERRPAPGILHLSQKARDATHAQRLLTLTFPLRSRTP